MRVASNSYDNRALSILNKHEDLFHKYGIVTIEQKAAFLAQCAHESQGFNSREENLFYSAEGLQKTFKYYKENPQQALSDARKPEVIANTVYADRMGNGNKASGDGYKYRGRGYIQLTGKNNYMAFSQAIGKNINDTIKYITSTAGALESALWYWQTNGLNKYADTGDFRGLTKAINGGFNGLADRKKHYDSILELLKQQA